MKLKLDKLSPKLQEKILEKPTLTIIRQENAFTDESFLALPKISWDQSYILPKTFDGRVVWSGLITPVRNQKNCGACWAYSTTSVLSERFNIFSLGQMNLILSPTRLLLCNFDTNNKDDDKEIQSMLDGACFGNTLVDAWGYLFTNGTVKEDCLPYDRLPKIFSISDISKFEKVADLPICSNVSGKNLDMCSDVSQSASGEEYGTPARFYRCSHYYTIENNEEAIKYDIFKHGPITTGMAVYPNFYTFDPKTEILGHDKENDMISGHAIEIVGWGEEKGKKYWIIKNSWGKDWGRDGYFYMERGNNCCYIEENCIAGLPDFFFGNEDPYGKEEWAETEKYIKEQKESSGLQSIGGGIDLTTGYSRRVMSTKPWIDFRKPVSLDKLLDPKTFYAGIDATKQKRKAFLKYIKDTENDVQDISMVLCIGVSIFLVVIMLYMIIKK
jgi:hypothetical protein